MSVKKCAVFGCDDRQSTRHSFPNPDKNLETFKYWIAACGNKELYEMDPQQIYKNRRVCAVHFEPGCVLNVKLLPGSIPTLLLPTPEERVLPASAQTCTQMEIDTENLAPVVSVPSTSKGTSVSSASEVQFLQSAPRMSPNALEEPFPSTSKTSAKDHSHARAPTPKLQIKHLRPGRKTNGNVLRSVGVTRSDELTPKARMLYKRSRLLNERVRLHCWRYASLCFKECPNLRTKQSSSVMPFPTPSCIVLRRWP